METQAKQRVDLQAQQLTFLLNAIHQRKSGPSIDEDFILSLLINGQQLCVVPFPSSSFVHCALVDRSSQFNISVKLRSGPVFAQGYDSAVFAPRDVEHAGSCGYEAISDQLDNDWGHGFQSVKNKLLAQIKSLPWADRRVFAVAVFGPVDVEQYRVDAHVSHLDAFVVPRCIRLLRIRSASLRPAHSSYSRSVV